MMADRPAEKIAFWPALSSDRDVCVLRAARWYSASDESYLGRD
jgi:hypothetical protein